MEEEVLDVSPRLQAAVPPKVPQAPTKHVTPEEAAKATVPKEPGKVAPPPQENPQQVVGVKAPKKVPVVHPGPAAQKNGESPVQKESMGILGVGVNTLSGELKEFVLDMNKVKVYKQPLNDSRLVIKTVDNATSLHREISGNASVAATIGPNIQAGLEFSGSHETRFNALSTYCLIKITTQVYREILIGGGELDDFAKALLRQNGNNNAMVFDIVGNAGVTSVTYGNEIIFVVELRTTNKQKINKTDTKLNLSGPNAVAVKGGLSTLLDSIDSSDVIDVSTYVRGLDKSRLAVDSLDGLKVFLDSFDKVKSTLMRSNKSENTTSTSDKNKSSTSEKPAEDNKGKTDEIKNKTSVASTSTPSSPATHTTLNFYQGGASAKSEASESATSGEKNTEKNESSATPPKVWDTVLTYETKPFYKIAKETELHRTARDYDAKLLPYKNLAAKILECYDRVDAFLQLCEYAENHLSLCEIGQKKAYRDQLKEKRDGLEKFKAQLYLKLLNLYKNPFEQNVVALADSLNFLIAVLNTSTCEALNFNEGSLLLREVTRKSEDRSHFLHNFSLPPEIRALSFTIKDYEGLARFSIKKRGLLGIANRFNKTVFNRMNPGSYIDMTKEDNQIKLKDAPTLYFTGFDLMHLDGNNYVIQVWGKLKADFVQIVPLSDDQLTIAVANTPFGDPGRGDLWNKAVAQVAPGFSPMWSELESAQEKQRRLADMENRRMRLLAEAVPLDEVRQHEVERLEADIQELRNELEFNAHLRPLPEKVPGKGKEEASAEVKKGPVKVGKEISEKERDDAEEVLELVSRGPAKRSRE